MKISEFGWIIPVNIALWCLKKILITKCSAACVKKGEKLTNMLVNIQCEYIYIDRSDYCYPQLHGFISFCYLGNNKTDAVFSGIWSGCPRAQILCLFQVLWHNDECDQLLWPDIGRMVTWPAGPRLGLLPRSKGQLQLTWQNQGCQSVSKMNWFNECYALLMDSSLFHVFYSYLSMWNAIQMHSVEINLYHVWWYITPAICQDIIMPGTVES